MKANWAWPSSHNACTYPHSNNKYKPCAISPQYDTRTLSFVSSYMDFKLEFDNDMTGTLRLGSTAANCEEAGASAEISFYPSGINAVNGAACAPPPDDYTHGSPAKDKGGYYIRNVKSGRYLHHWYAQEVSCNNPNGHKTRMEVRVTPDCVELHLVDEYPATLPAPFVSFEVQRFHHTAWKSATSYFCADPDVLGDYVAIDWPPIGTNFTSPCFGVKNIPDNTMVSKGYLGRSSGHDVHCSAPNVMFTLPVDAPDAAADIDAFNGWISGPCTVNVILENPPETSAPTPTPIPSTLNWLIDGVPAISSSNGYAAISFCVSCDEGEEWDASISSCTIVQTPIPSDCCHLGPAAVGVENLCGPNGPSSDCALPLESPTNPAATDITVVAYETGTTSNNFVVRGDGHSFHVTVPPQLSGSITTNDHIMVELTNNASSGYRKVKMNFNMDGPRGVTGIGAFMRDPVTKTPLGIHVQLSKNWHTQTGLYNGYWWTGVVHTRVPPDTTTTMELVITYQYFGGLHGVSHSQLSLVGWGTNGLWEEVGLGSSGESITYEPDGQHRRQSILDTRPFLVTPNNQNHGQGNPDSTGWTENHGGSDWLNAVTNNGFWQYLVNNTALHIMNGPRLTNATCTYTNLSGIRDNAFCRMCKLGVLLTLKMLLCLFGSFADHGTTVDTNLEVSRFASTWSTDDMARHLHSFHYKVKSNMSTFPYARFAMYVLGGDNYNYIQNPSFAYGIGESIYPGEDLLDVEPWSNISGNNTLAGFDYANGYYQVDAPAGCGQPEHSSSSSCWFMFQTQPAQSAPGDCTSSLVKCWHAHRGIIVRNFKAQFGGVAWPPAGDEATTSPFTFNIIRGMDSGRLTVELGLPQAVLNGTIQLLEGDFMTGDIEQFLLPVKIEAYYGNSIRLANWYSTADVAGDATNAWKIVGYEASRGDELGIDIFDGTLERKYTPRIRASSTATTSEAKFNLRIPTDWPGVLPVSISGVFLSDATFNTESDLGHRLWRWVSDAWVEVAPDGKYQVDRDIADGSYTFTYSLKLEFETPTLQGCEQFYFGTAATLLATENSPIC